MGRYPMELNRHELSASITRRTSCPDSCQPTAPLPLQHCTPATLRVACRRPRWRRAQKTLAPPFELHRPQRLDRCGSATRRADLRRHDVDDEVLVRLGPKTKRGSGRAPASTRLPRKVRTAARGDAPLQRSALDCVGARPGRCAGVLPRNAVQHVATASVRKTWAAWCGSGECRRGGGLGRRGSRARHPSSPFIHSCA
jgi:hypothetical protein